MLSRAFLSLKFLKTLTRPLIGLILQRILFVFLYLMIKYLLNDENPELALIPHFKTFLVIKEELNQTFLKNLTMNF